MGDLGSALAASFAADGFMVYAADIAAVPDRPGITDVIVGFRNAYQTDTTPLQDKIDALRRYADDFIIMGKSKQAGDRVFTSIRKYLERELKLEVNEAKSKVARLNECTFLGFQIIREKRGQPENFRI